MELSRILPSTVANSLLDSGIQGRGTMRWLSNERGICKSHLSASTILLSQQGKTSAGHLRVFGIADQHFLHSWITVTNITLYLILLERRLRLSIRSLALAVIPSNWRATGRGCHTRNRADFCNFVCLCSCCERKIYSPLNKVEVPAYVCFKKLQLKNKPSCSDHCIIWKKSI